MRLPENDDEGALPLSQVLDVLRSAGIKVMSVDDRTYLFDGEVLEVHFFTDPVRRKVTQTLARKFGINTVQFYYPGVDLH